MRLRRIVPVLALLAIIVAGLIVGAHLGLLDASDPAKVRNVIARVRALPFLGVSFIGLYVLAAAGGVPATVLTLAGGVIFGPVSGMILNWTSDMLAATIAFASARWAVRSLRKTTADPRLATNRGFLGLLRLRVIPVVPFAALNYGSAVYGMPWRPYLAATALGITPSVIVYTLFASSLAEGATGAGKRALITASICAAGIIGLTLLPRLTRKTLAGSAEIQ